MCNLSDTKAQGALCLLQENIEVVTRADGEDDDSFLVHNLDVSIFEQSFQMLSQCT